MGGLLGLHRKGSPIVPPLSELHVSARTFSFSFLPQLLGRRGWLGQRHSNVNYSQIDSYSGGSQAKPNSWGALRQV